MASEVDPRSMFSDFISQCSDRYDVAANQPVELNDASTVWFVERGTVDVFAAEYDASDMKSPLKHLFRLEAGRFAFGVDPGEHAMRLQAKGLHGTVLCGIPRNLLIEFLEANDAEAITDEFVGQTDRWVTEVSESVARDFEGRPPIEFRLSPGIVCDKGTASPHRGVVWLSSESIEVSYLDLINANELFPLTPDGWIRVQQETEISCLPTEELSLSLLLREALPYFHELAFSAESLNRRILMLDEANLQVAQVSGRKSVKENAERDLEALYRKQATFDDETTLLQALRLIGEHEDFEIVEPTNHQFRELTLQQYCEASGIRRRRLSLTEESNWWLGDSGALLAFQVSDGQPVVLLPSITGRYRVVNPVTGASHPADKNTSNAFTAVYCLYRSFKSRLVRDWRELIRVGRARSTRTLVGLLITGLAAGVLGLAPAVAINALVSEITPGNSAIALIQFSAILVGLAVVASLLHVLRGSFLMKLEGRYIARIDAAIWDRLLRLRVGFFRDFRAGDLAARTMVVRELRDHVSGVAADGILSTLFMLPAFCLLFYYDIWLGWTALFLALVMIAATAVFCLLQIEPQQRLLESSRKLAGIVHQFIGGIKKLRTTGAEDSAFAAWARLYRDYKDSEIQLLKINEHIAAFGAAIPAFVSGALFWVVAAGGMGELPTASFLAVFTALMVLCLLIEMLGNSTISIATFKPTLAQIKPLLENPVFAGGSSRTFITLSGEILFDKVSFAYSADGPLILDEISFRAKPGEFVAIVGKSGSGKSTVLRLALGLEEPHSGAIYYDSRDLAQLDLGAVRNQIGVVMQDSSLLHGRVIDAINGMTGDLTEDDAWAAARLAGVEEDIRAMPMGLFTTVAENSSTFSGGQSQRMQIAAALVRKPRILFLDEPTSWLDTKSQALTMAGITNSTSTRIVIAHRLSTIRQADRIYVMEEGRIVQSGGYDELFDVDGPFRDLAIRQTA